MLYVKQKCPVTYDEKRTGDPLAGSASATVSLEDFRRLQKFSDIFGSLWICYVIFKRTGTPKIKISCLYM